ncbi:MAG: hypothetical protein ACREJ2_03260 [Planctomycetota bacterium]
MLQEVCNLFAPHFLTDLYLQNPLVMVFQSVLGLLCWVPLILALVLLAQSMSDRRRYSAGVRYVTGAIVAAFGLRMVINMIWVAITFSAAFQAGGHVSAQVLARTTIDDNPVLYSGTQGLVLLISLAAVIIVIRNMMQMKGAHVVPPARRGRYAAGRAEDPDDGYDEGDEGDVDTEGGWNDAPRPRGQFRRRAQESRPEGSDDQP